MKLVTIFVVFALFVLSFVGGLIQGSHGVSVNSDLLLQNPREPLTEFSFTSSTGGTFSNQDLANKWTLFFIGYTFCPDICPTTLADLDRIYPKLVEPVYSNIQVVFISVDPNRDKAAHLAEYINYFNPHFIALSSTHEKLFPFTQKLNLAYSIVDEGHDETYYLIDHSASLVLINPDGEYHATFKAGINEHGIAHVNMDAMVEDIHRIQRAW